MSMMKTRASFLTVAVLASFALSGGPGAGPAHACSCGARPLESEFQDSAAVFSGEVRDIDEDELSPVGGTLDTLGKVTFEVEEPLKGVSAESVEVYGQGDEESCGIEFEKGESYLVYAYRTEENDEVILSTSLCQSTKPLADAEADIRYLKAENLITPETGGFSIPLTLSAIGAGGILMLMGAYFGRRTRRG